MRKKILLLVILIFLVVPFVSAQNISIDYPEEVTVGEEFSFKITLSNFEEDIYDVKIDIIAGGERIARILAGGEWKSTYYYINDIISPDEEKEFILKVLEYIGSAEITVKIKNSGGSSEVFEGYEIEIVESGAEDDQEPPPINDFDEEEDDEDEDEETNESATETTSIPDYEEISNGKKQQPITLDVIKLNPKVIKSEDDTGDNKDLGDYAVYGFVVFCILLGFLFALKKYRFKKNEAEV